MGANSQKEAKGSNFQGQTTRRLRFQGLRTMKNGWLEITVSLHPFKETGRRIRVPGWEQCLIHSMIVSGSPKRWEVGSIFHLPEGKDYKWYISGIFPANWGIKNATDPTLF